MKKHLQASTHSSEQLQHSEYRGRVVEELVGDRQGGQSDDLTLNYLEGKRRMSQLSAQGSSCTVDPHIILTSEVVLQLSLSKASMLVVTFQKAADGEAEVTTRVLSGCGQGQGLRVVKSLKRAEVVLSSAVGVNGRG
jgi:hypothetical protein